MEKKTAAPSFFGRRKEKTMTLSFPVDEFLRTAPGNRIPASGGEWAGTPLYDAPIFGVADACDPLFEALRAPEAVGEMHRTPAEWLPGAVRVISFFLPFSAAVRQSNREGELPSLPWLYARFEGQDLLLELCRAIRSALEAEGYESVIPALSPDFAVKPLTVTGEDGTGTLFFSSRWSERHAAFVCGLGTFGLSRGLITEKGMAGRFGSLITTAPLDVTPRPYTDITEYCIRCGACIRRCPVHAIDENGKRNEPCSAFLDETKRLCVPRYGCGKCQVGVPCMEKRP